MHLWLTPQDQNRAHSARTPHAFSFIALVIARPDAQSNCWQNFDCNRPRIIHRSALHSTLLTIRLRVGARSDGGVVFLKSLHFVRVISI